jgi:hypothetical protein
VIREPQRRAEVKQPDLLRIDAVPMRAFTGAQEEVDRGSGGAAVTAIRPAPGLDIVATLWVRKQAE